MSTQVSDQRVDRLYRLLPSIYRILDARAGYPLQALLRVIAEQVNVVEDGIAQQYENWFIETAADWAVPYIADLIGYRPVPEAGQQVQAEGAAAEALSRILIPRREVANTIRYRRRKGTLALLEDLAGDVGGWPAHAVEFYRLLGWNQNINHPHDERAHLLDLRRMDELDRIGGPFDGATHGVDVRRINSHRMPGRHNIPSVGVFVWRLQVFPVTYGPGYCREEEGPHLFTFSILGQDAPLFVRPSSLPGAALEKELSRPAPIRRLAFEHYKELLYGPERSLAVWADGWAGFGADAPIPAANVIPADLSDWHYVPPARHIAVDPVLGRIAFPPAQVPKRGVRVLYLYGFSAPIGGGEYPRQLADPTPRDVRLPDPKNAGQTVLQPSEPKFYRVGRDQPYRRLNDAIAAWRKDKPYDAVIELFGSSVFVEPVELDVPAQANLVLRAANGGRPVIRLLDWQADLPDSLAIVMGRGSRVTLDGLMVTGRGVTVTGPEPEEGGLTAAPICASHLLLRHCTLVPGWGIGPDCEPSRGAEPSLRLAGVRAEVSIEHSILGSILVRADEVRIDPIPIRITDSIVDATGGDIQAIGGHEYRPAHAIATILRCTVFGVVELHAVELAENSIFNDCVHVARRQIGCMRYCYVPAGCRTPRRHACQPDLVTQAVLAAVTDRGLRQQLVAAERIRAAPQFGSDRYGRPDYAQLAADCAPEIRRGADDESEMGVFHDLYEPQRAANLLARLEEFTPAGADAGIVNAT